MYSYLLVLLFLTNITGHQQSLAIFNVLVLTSVLQFGKVLKTKLKSFMSNTVIVNILEGSEASSKHFLTAWCGKRSELSVIKDQASSAHPFRTAPLSKSSS